MAVTCLSHVKREGQDGCISTSQDRTIKEWQADDVIVVVCLVCCMMSHVKWGLGYRFVSNYRTENGEL